MHGSETFLTPDPSDIETMRKQFNFNNLEDVNYKVMSVNELQRANISHLTLVVYNTVDTEGSYVITIVSDVSGAKFSGTLLVSMIMLIGTGTIMILLFVWAIVQYLNEQKYIASLKYEAELHASEMEEMPVPVRQ
jgi:hypothetical protein